ncbi:MAG: fused response regulator/phosphatase [Capsulimonas sp.]|uniref:PP2C family protein-serine/threonine phosphatase n=1 Tax=Capsulimonas sp. TaxID=2494211 RepID=UPI00326619DF
MPDATPMTILNVDDNEEKRYIVSRMLRAEGFTVTEAENGREALRLAQDRPDLIVLDVKLPDISGFEVCQILKADSATGSIPVLHLSAHYTNSGDRSEGLDRGADAYLNHPVQQQELASTVRALLRMRTAENQAKALYERERRIVETLQRALLLAVPSDTYPGLDVATFYHAAWEEASIAGDFFDTFALPEGKLALVVGDASGKGLAAAAHTAEVKYAMRAILHETPHPGQALSRLNDFICHSYQTHGYGLELVVALAVSVVDLEAGEAHFASAGAEPPLVLRASGVAEEIAIGGLPLGVYPGTEYKVDQKTLDVGDALLITTDGITEARRSGDFLGYEGFIELSKRFQSSSSTQEYGQSIVEEARAFAGGKFQDDVCLLIARRV